MIMVKQTKAKTAALSGLKKYELRYRKVLDAAAAVFAEKGYHGTTTKNIADKIGIRQASLYYYASSKEELLEGVCEIGMEGFLESAQHINKTERRPQDKIRLVFFEHLAPLWRQPNYMQVFLSCRKHLPRQSRHKIGEQARNYEELIESILRDGVDAGELRADLDCRLTTLALLGLCNSAPQWVKKQRGLKVEQIAQQFSDIFLTGIEIKQQSKST